MSLISLRSDPATATTANVYRTGPAKTWPLAQGTLVAGGPCMVGGKEAQAGVYDLSAHPQSPIAVTDYFYPWLRTGVGWVAVPKTAPEGTIVMTGGLNGCTLVITENGGNLNFYHDGDSKYLKPGMAVGTEKARITPDMYDPSGFAITMFSNALRDAALAGVKPEGDVSYGHFVVAVKKNGKFGFYGTGVMSLNGLTRIPQPAPSLLATVDC